MNDICVPIPRIPEAKHAEVSVTVEGKVKAFNYRVESFAWQPDESIANASDFIKIRAERIDKLKHSIADYDKNWELLQIMDNAEVSGFLHLLYREKS